MDKSFLLAMVAAMARGNRCDDLADEEIRTTANCRWQKEANDLFVLCSRAILDYYGSCVAFRRIHIAASVIGDSRARKFCR
jgi:hypothetical protein